MLARKACVSVWEKRSKVECEACELPTSSNSPLFVCAVSGWAADHLKKVGLKKFGQSASKRRTVNINITDHKSN